MKTIITTLPIYDKLAKQTYQKAIVNKEQTGQDQPVPINCPRHRLPSLLWNVQSDAPGEIDKIELIGSSGENLDLASSIGNYNASVYDTLTTSGTAITSAINLAGNAYAVINPVFSANIGEVITIRFTATLTSGVLPYFFLDNGTALSTAYQHANIGYNELRLIAESTSANTRVVMYSSAAANFATTAISIKKNDITSLFNTSPAYIQSGAPPAGAAMWLNNATAYDTFTANNKVITSAIKTTAAGVASCWNVFVIGSVSTTITSGESIRIRADLGLNSGTAPKVVLQRTDTGVNISNVVTLSAGVNIFFLTATSTITGFAICIYNSDTELTNFDCELSYGEKSVIPRLYTALTDDYFQYKGNTLGLLLPLGTYYLKITTLNGYVYYSDYFVVGCIYENLITGWINSPAPNAYETFTTSGTVILSAIESGASGYALSNSFNVIKGEKIRVKLFLTNSNQLPTLYLINNGWSSDDSQALAVGLNDIELTSAWDGVSYLLIRNTAASSFSTTEVLAGREYSEKYLTINFSNTCDLGDIVYQDGFTQSLWFESETMENTYPTEEEGQKNGEGRFVRTFARLVKKYLARTKDMPGYMVDVFNRLKLHDTVELIDLVGDVNDVYNIEVEHEWLFDDKYYAKLDLTFDYDEYTLVSGCCTNIT